MFPYAPGPVRASDDLAKLALELWCESCDGLVCDIEPGDNLETLAITARQHETEHA